MRNLLLLVMAVVLGCGKQAKPPEQVPNTPEADAAIEAAIKAAVGKSKGKLTNTDLNKVKQLLLMKKGIGDLKPLAKVGKLLRLGLSGNEITDLSPLSHLKELEWLDLRENKISDLTTLRELKSLKELNLMDNPHVTKKEVEKLQEALPGCKIFHNAS